jgi:hypothetical protein
MESLPNEVSAGIYAGLTLRDKFAFAATCRAYNSFVPDGFPAFARKFRSVLAEINRIKYGITSKDISVRLFEGRGVQYDQTAPGDMTVIQTIPETRITRAQSRRYEIPCSITGMFGGNWPDLGRRTDVYVRWIRNERPMFDVVRCRVIYRLVDGLPIIT